MIRNALNLRYVWFRLRVWRYERANPGLPWLTEGANMLLESWLRPTDRVLEFGSGRSTLWLAGRVAHVTSVEHDGAWHAEVVRRLADGGLAERVQLSHVACELAGEAEPERHAYADAAETLPDGSVDLALVDGRIRLTCLRIAMRKVRSGGLLVLDNAERFVPNLHNGRHTTVIGGLREPPTEGWRETLRALSAWRAIHTSNGVWDTRLWVKP